MFRPYLAVGVVCLAGTFACSAAVSEPDEADASSASEALRGRFRPSAVFTSSNSAEGNSVLAFRRSPRGTLEMVGDYPTGGLGTGTGLGSQGALAVSEEGRFLVTVDAGSNELTSFAVRGAELSLRGRVSSSGSRPVSVAIQDHRVYVVNAGEPANVAGYRLGSDGGLTPIPGSVQPLSAAGAGPAQVGISPSGNVLVVTEKATSRISTFNIGRTGALTPRGAFASAGTTPFGFTFTPQGDLIVSEAGTASTSSYDVHRSGEVTVISAAVPDLQRAPCWATVSPDGHFAYIANAGSSSISGYHVDPDGSLTLLHPDGVTGAAGQNSRPLDMAVVDRDLYLLDAGNHGISHFRIAPDGNLKLSESELALPPTAAGLAAY